MTPAEFEAQLKDAGYRDVGTRPMEPRPVSSEHVHDTGCTDRPRR